MPPVSPSPQGSRAGLITALVIFVLLSATAILFAIYYGTNWQAEIAMHKADVAKLTPSVAASDLSSAEVIKINDEAKPKLMSGIALALSQRNAEAKLITGVASPNIDGVMADTTRTIGEVRSALQAAKVDVSIPDDNLLSTVRALSSQIVTLTQNVAAAQAQTKAAQKETADAVAAREAALAKKDALIEEATKATADVKAEKDKLQATVTKAASDIGESSNTAIAAAETRTQSVRDELTKVQAQLKTTIGQLESAIRQLSKYRIDTTKAMLQPAGYVTRIPSDSICFISLGEGQQVAPGLTFEVYDKTKGLPPLTSTNTSNNELPAGKASIEIIRVLAGTSECRIIRTAPGYHIIEGDLILNLVYNAHAKFAFAVFGDFDLANTGQATPGDAEVMRRLVSQWGGRVQDAVNIDTDFLVLGKEPVVLPLPENATPIDQERHEKAQKALDAYTAVQTAAIHLNVPILSQNRFLYFVGYYDQAKR